MGRFVSLQIGHNQRCDDALNRAGDQDMTQHHGRNGDGQPIGPVKRRAVGGMEQRRLDAELYAGAEGSSVDSGEAGDAGGNDPARGRQRRVAAEKPVDGIGHQWQNNGHVEGIGSVG